MWQRAEARAVIVAGAAAGQPDAVRAEALRAEAEAEAARAAIAYAAAHAAAVAAMAAVQRDGQRVAEHDTHPERHRGGADVVRGAVLNEAEREDGSERLNR